MHTLFSQDIHTAVCTCNVKLTSSNVVGMSNEVGVSRGGKDLVPNRSFVTFGSFVSSW